MSTVLGDIKFALSFIYYVTHYSSLFFPFLSSPGGLDFSDFQMLQSSWPHKPLSCRCVWVTCSSCQEEKMEKCELGVPLEASLDWNWSGGHLIHFKSFKRVEGCLCVLVLVLVCNRCVTMTGYLSSSDMVYMEKHWDLTQKTHAHTLSQWKTRWFRAH